MPALRQFSDERKKAVLLTVLAGFLWGTSFPAIKIGLTYMDAYTFVFLRFLTASLVMLAVLLFKQGFSLSFSKKRLVLFLGVVNGVAYLLEYVGMVFTTASKSSLFINLSAVWVALLSPIVLREHLGAKKTIGVTVSIFGVLLMTTNLNFASLTQGGVVGDVLVLGAGVGWAFFMVYNKPLVEASKSLVLPMTLLLFATLLPLLPFAPSSFAAVTSLPFEAWLIILYTAVLCWVVPYYFYLRALRHISPVTSAVILLTEIIVAVTMSVFWLGEVFTVFSGVGAVLVVIAILLVS